MRECNIVSKSLSPLMVVWKPFSNIYLTATTTKLLNSQLIIVTSIVATGLSHFYFLKISCGASISFAKVCSVNSDINFNFLLINGRIQLGTCS